jgi:hypothetical protein
MLHEAEGGMAPDPHVGRRNQPHHHKILDEPSSFVGEVYSCLRATALPRRVRLAAEMERQGVSTPREFASFVESRNDPFVRGTLIRAYQRLYKNCSPDEMAQGVPALVSLLSTTLLDRQVVRHDERLGEVLNQLLEARSEYAEVASKVAEVVTERERWLLSFVVNNASLHRTGYLQSIEMLCEIFPETRSLESFLTALDRMGPKAVDGPARDMTLHCVSAIAAASFEETFCHLGRALCDPSRPERTPWADVAAKALRDSAREAPSCLHTFIWSGEAELRSFALRVIIFAGAESDAEIYYSDGTHISTEGKAALANHIHAAYLTDSSNSLEIPNELALAALASISPLPEDVGRVRREMQTILKDGGVPSRVLCQSAANGAERVLGVEAVQPFEPLPKWCRKKLGLTFRPSGTYSLDGDRPPLKKGDFEDFALEIAEADSFEEVRAICRDRAENNTATDVLPRPVHSLELFEDLLQAGRFLTHYQQLFETGLEGFAAQLFPEFLSAVARVGDLERDFNDRDESIETDSSVARAIKSMRYLSEILANLPVLIPLATSRLNTNDIEFIAEMPEDYHFGADMTLATYELRAALEGDIQGESLAWQEELVEWWRLLEPEHTRGVTPESLARVSAISEMRTKGSSLKLLELLPLGRTFDRELFRAFAYGLLFQEGVSESILALLQSKCPFDLARGFFLGQMLRQKLRLEDARRLLTIAESALDEPGALSLDAVCTLGALSASPDRALALLRSKAATGVDESLHTVTAMSAAARILDRVRRRQVRQ